MTDLREKIAGNLRQHVSGYYAVPPNEGHWEAVADAILAIPELQEMMRDAERYRYWRKNHGWTGYFDDGATNSEEPDAIDAAIDAAKGAE